MDIGGSGNSSVIYCCGGKTRNKRLATEQFQDICVYMQYNLTKVDTTIKTLQVETQWVWRHTVHPQIILKSRTPKIRFPTFWEVISYRKAHYKLEVWERVDQD